MSTATKVGAFVAGLAVLFGAAFGVGKLFDDEPQRYTLRAELDGTDVVTVTIRDQDETVRDLDIRHEKKVHLIAVRKDFGDYQHLHPEPDNSGSWVVEGARFTPGDWRLYADFKPTGEDPAVAHADVTVPGTPGASGPTGLTTEAVVDGYRVQASENNGSLAFAVSRDGRPVTDLETYLGAYGHLVVIRESDLEFLHVHPDAGPAGPTISFGVAGTTPDRYRAYFEFQHRGVVRTVPFTQDLGAAGDHEGGGHGDH